MAKEKVEKEVNIEPYKGEICNFLSSWDVIIAGKGKCGLIEGKSCAYLPHVSKWCPNWREWRMKNVKEKS